MKKVLIVNGHEKYGFAEGKLNGALAETIRKELEARNVETQTTVIQEGYDVKEEQEKYKWADVVVYQFPIYWFDVSGLMKRYMDEVFEYGVFFGMGESDAEYGKTGMMKGEKYFFSTTWNAPENAFSNSAGLMEGKDVDDALFHLHKTHEFIGMEKLNSISFHDVIKNPRVDEFTSALKNHVNKIF